MNYKAAMIKAHFGDGAKWNATICYIEEDRPLGTAGALRLIKDRPDSAHHRHERRSADAD